VAQTLSVRFQGADCAVFRNNDGTVTQIGLVFTPAAGTESSDIRNAHQNLATMFVDADDLYCWVSTEIRKHNTGTGVWDVVRTLSDMGATSTERTQHTGLGIALNSSGVQVLFGMFWNTVTNRIAVTQSTDGTTWAETDSTLNTAMVSGGLSRSTFMYQNSMIALANGNLGFVGFNPSTLAFTVFDPGLATPSSLGHDWTVINNQVFIPYLATATPNTRVDLLELSGGVFTTVLTGTGGGFDIQLDGNSRPGLANFLCSFKDKSSGDLIVMGWERIAAGNRGLRAYRINTTTFAFSEITSIVVAVAIRWPNGPSIAGSDIRIFKSEDFETDPANPVIAVWISIGIGTVFTRYVWNGVALVMTVGTAGQDWGNALFHGSRGGGNYSFADAVTELNVRQSKAESKPAAGVIRRFWTAHSSPLDNNPDYEVEGLFSADGEAPSTSMTLIGVGKDSGPAATPTLSGNKAVGVTPDNGASVFFYDWSAVAQGISGGNLPTRTSDIQET